MIKNKMSKRILAFALCALLTAGMIPESILAAEAGESTEESAGISGNEAVQEPVSDNKTAPGTGKVSPGDEGEGMAPSENEATEPVEDPSGIPEETMPTETVSEDEAEETVSEDDIGEAVSGNEIPETVSENETEEPAGNPGTWADVIKVALDNGDIYHGGADAPSGVSYDANTHTLTLDNFKNERGYIKEGLYSYSGIYANGDLIIEVKGDCVVKPKPENAGLGGQTGISVLGNLTIRNVSGSDGRLTVHANEGDKIGTRTVTEGIFAQGNLTIVKNGNNTITVSATSGYSEGWRKMYNLNDDSRGIHCYGNLVIDGKGTKGGATVIGQNENNLYGVSYGISSLKDIEIKDGAKVIAKGSKGDKAGRVSCGLYAGNTIKVSGEKTIVEAYGGTISSFEDRTEGSNSDNISYGIMVGTYTFDYYGTPGSINIEGGTVTAKGGGTSEYHKDPKENGQRVRSIGLYTNDLSIGNASVITEGADPNPGLSYGTYIKADKAVNLSVRYGKLTGKGYTGAIVCSRSINYDTPILNGSTNYSGVNPVIQNNYDNAWKYASMDAKSVVIDIDDWTYGDTPKTPSVHNLNKYGDGNVTATCKFNVDNPTNAGAYRASATLSNGMTGFKTINILPRNISDAVITFGTQNTYNGSSQEAVITSVKCGGKTLAKGTDYKIIDGGTAVDVGDTLLTIQGMGNYKGTKSGAWSLQKATLNYTDFNGIVSRDNEHIEYDGTYKTVSTPYKEGVGAVTVFYLYKEDEEWKYYENKVKEPHTYYVFFDVAESRNYKAANKLTYGSRDDNSYRMTIYKKYGEPVDYIPTARVKAGQTVDLMPNIAGALGTPEFTIDEDNTSGGCTVDKDSGLFQAGNNTGTCRVKVITSPSDYYMGWRATVTAYITVTVDNKESVALSVTQTGTVYGTPLSNPVFTPAIGSPVIKYSGIKRDGTQYSETSEKPTEAGNYTVKITGESGSYSYSGSAAFKIDPKTIAGAAFTFGEQETYNGSVKDVKNLSVKDGTNDLTASDYDIISGGTAIDVAEQQLTIEGKGNYTGTATSAAKWKLKKKTPVAGDFSVTAASTRDYTGEPAIPVSEPSLNSGRIGCGDITIYYTGTGTTSYEKNVTPPADAGLYDVTFDVAEGTNFSSATGLTYGTLTINKVDFTGDKVVSSGGQVNKETTLDLTSYANNGTLGNVTVTEGGGYLSATPTITGKKLKFTFKNGTAVGSEATVTVPVTDCKNYNDYTLTVTLTARQQYTLEHVAANKPTCTMNGNTEYWFATDEDGIYFYDENGTQPAFEGDIIKPALGHDWSEWKVTREATHTVPGEETRECKREGCNEKETREIPLVPYIVTFSLNGKPGAAPVSQNIINGGKVSKPADPTAEGFTFLGWFMDAAGEDYFDFNTLVTGNMTLYAKWVSKEVKLYTVSFDLNGKDGTKPADQKVAEGSMAGSPGNPTSAGFIFRGWYTDKDCKSLYDFSDPVTADITLYARWEEDVPPGAFKIFYTQSALAFDPYKGLTYNTGNEHYEWTYTGSALKPAITVTDHKGNMLTEGSDYTVKYTGNKDVSAKPAKVTVTGKGNFSGSRSLEFYILKADFAKAKAKKLLVVPDSFAVQKGKKISPVVIYQGITLDAKKDYKLSNTGAIKEDTTVDIEGNGTFFTGKISGIPVKVLSAEEVKNNTIKVSLSPEKHVYTGSAQELSDKELVVKTGSSTSPLAKGKDYKVIYSKNTDAGKAKVTVMALGSYIGNVSKTFTIEADTKSNITAALKEGTSTGYDPKGATPALNVKTDKTTLKAGKDYKVAYSNNKSKGEADYKLTFIGNFKGHKAVTGKFTITEGAFASASVNSADLIYGKPNLYRSAPFVSIGGVSVGKKDYTVKYFDGTKELGEKEKITLDAGQTEKTITVKATGKNNYKAEDSAAFTYRVVKVSGNMINLSKAKIVGKDTTKGVKGQEYTGEYVMPEIDVLVKQGKTWVALDPANYTVAYINNINKGKATILVTGKGTAAAGSKTAKFTIKAKNMSKFNK